MISGKATVPLHLDRNRLPSLPLPLQLEGSGLIESGSLRALIFQKPMEPGTLFLILAHFAEFVT